MASSAAGARSCPHSRLPRPVAPPGGTGPRRGAGNRPFIARTGHAGSHPASGSRPGATPPKGIALCVVQHIGSFPVIAAPGKRQGFLHSRHYGAEMRIRRGIGVVSKWPLTGNIRAQYSEDGHAAAVAADPDRAGDRGARHAVLPPCQPAREPVPAAVVSLFLPTPAGIAVL
jgi:hypothetical protein